MNWANIIKANVANIKAAAATIASVAEAKQEERAYARRTHVQLSFDGVNISRDMQPYFMSLTYTDNEEDDADDLQIKLQDRDAIWLEKWLGSAIDAASSTRSYNTGSSGSDTANSYTVNAKSGLNVRSGPGSGYSILGTLPYGTSVNVTGTSGSWSVIQYSGKTAYVFTTYLTKGGSGGSAGSNTASGFLINATIVKDNWRGDGKDAVLDCGSFELDSVQASGPPSTITLKATGLPFSASIRQTAKSKAWEKYNLSGIAKEMAANNGMSCLFLADYDPFYKRTEQYNVSDIAFLSRLCKNAGISLKCSNKILVLFDQSNLSRRLPRSRSPAATEAISNGISNRARRISSIRAAASGTRARQTGDALRASPTSTITRIPRTTSSSKSGQRFPTRQRQSTSPRSISACTTSSPGRRPSQCRATRRSLPA